MSVFPEFATFFIVPRHDDPKTLQLQAEKVLPDGRKLLLVIDKKCQVNPSVGFAVRVHPGRVLFDGRKNVLATVFYEKSAQEVEDTRKVLVSERPKTGRFVGEVPTMDPAKVRQILNGPNVLRSAAELPRPKETTAPSKKKEKGGKKENKKQVRKHLLQVAGG